MWTNIPHLLLKTFILYLEYSWLSLGVHSRILTWRILWREEAGGLRFTGWQTVGRNWNNLARHWSTQPVAQNSNILPQTCALFFHICVLSLQPDCHIIQNTDTKQCLAHTWYWPSPPKNLPEEKKHKTIKGQCTMNQQTIQTITCVTKEKVSVC